MGCLHVWEGDVIPSGGALTWKVNGKWADLFIQNEADCFHFLENLTNKERNLIHMGYRITTRNVPSDYFIQE